MYVLKGAHQEIRDWTRAARSDGKDPEAGGKDSPREDLATDGEGQKEAESQALIYIDPREFTRDCIGRWLQNSLSEFRICLLPGPDQIETASIVRDQIRAVLINVGRERMSSPTATRLLSRVSELLPTVPVVVVSDYEDPESIREAFALGVRGYIPTSLASMVAAGAVHLVCLGGTFAPAAPLLSQGASRHRSAAELLFDGFTERQSQILDCLRRGMANKLIAYELNMCESTVKVHVRNIMKKLNATNRTQVAYMTRGFFEGADQYQRA